MLNLHRITLQRSQPYGTRVAKETVSNIRVKLSLISPGLMHPPL